MGLHVDVLLMHLTNPSNSYFTNNPYGDGKSCKCIIEILKKMEWSFNN